MAVANALAYYDLVTIMAAKSFIDDGRPQYPGNCTIKHVKGVIVAALL
jgi:hypothetical protein